MTKDDNNYQYSSSKRDNVKMYGPLPSSEWNLFVYQVSCLLVLRMIIELRVFNKKKKLKNDNTVLAILEHLNIE